MTIELNPTSIIVSALPFTVEDLARTALVRILPRSHYRLAAQSDSRFQTFAATTARIAYRQQGATPAFLLFSGPGQDPRAAAIAAAAWAAANWRPNAVQRSVRPGVVVVQVAPRAEVTTAGPIQGSAVPAAVWTVDSKTGRVEVVGKPPGSPAAADIKRAAAALMKGLPAPSLGEVDLAERTVTAMPRRTISMPRSVSVILGFVWCILALRYGIGGLFSLLVLPSVLSGGLIGAPATTQLFAAGIFINVLLLAGVVLGLGMYFNVRNMAYSVPGFSSPEPRTRNLAWAAYAVVMIGLVFVVEGFLPAAERAAAPKAVIGQYLHVTATVDEDGSETVVALGGDLTVDLSRWPSSEWSGVQFKTSNPSVLTLDVPAPAGGAPTARFTAHQVGTSRVDATSADGRYTFQLRVNIISS